MAADKPGTADDEEVVKCHVYILTTMACPFKL
jgi:hypothetical protein